MSEPNRSVSTETLTVTEIVRKLKRNHFLIPTFQRDFVWQPADVLSLWDSMYRAYPIGSIICWNTTEQLETHRRIGGYILDPDPLDQPDVTEYRYILDGQQRLTSFFISYLAGRGVVDEDERFNFELYFDPTASDDPGTDWKDGVFLFANGRNKRNDALRQRQVDPNLIIRVGDEDALDTDRLATYATMQGYTPEARLRLYRLNRLLQEYRIPFIFTKGVGLGDVCEIYERINQKGRRLSTTDIVVARTFRGGAHGFSLRSMFDEIRDGLSERAMLWKEIDQQLLLQMIGVCLRVEYDQSGQPRNPYGFDKNALLNLTPAAIEPHKLEIQRAIIATIEFLVEQGIFSVQRLPATYLALPLCAYHYMQPHPNESAMRQWLWRSAFDHTSIDSDADVYRAINKTFAPLRKGRTPTYDPLTLSLRSFIRRYRFDHSFRLAMLAFLSSLRPLDLADGHLVTDYRSMAATGSIATQHHIFPLAFLTRMRASTSDHHKDSVMNICWMGQRTNLRIGNNSPAEYFTWYLDKRGNKPKEQSDDQSAEELAEKSAEKPSFEAVLASHLIPLNVRNLTTDLKSDYQAFLFARARLFANALRAALPDVPLTITGE